MDSATATPEPTRRERFEAELAAWEKKRDEAATEIDKLERFLATEAGLGITAWRKARRAIADGTASTGGALESATQAWAREDDSPEKAVKRIGLLAARVDVEVYADALAGEVKASPEVKGALARRLATFAGKG